MYNTNNTHSFKKNSNPESKMIVMIHSIQPILSSSNVLPAGTEKNIANEVANKFFSPNFPAMTWKHVNWL